MNERVKRDTKTTVDIWSDQMAEETHEYVQKKIGLFLLSLGYHLRPMTLCTRS